MKYSLSTYCRNSKPAGH